MALTGDVSSGPPTLIAVRPGRGLGPGRVIRFLLSFAGFALAACTSLAFYPQQAAQKAADSLIDDIRSVVDRLPEPALPTAAASELKVDSAAITIIRKSIAGRFQLLAPRLDSGAIGLSLDGLLVVRDFNLVASAERAELVALLVEDNKDRGTLYREIARANGRPDWEVYVRSSFGTRWISRAPSGWYYLDSSGAWLRKR
jgi:uncharacterized protein YdbL (DUF1318 family)